MADKINQMPKVDVQDGDVEQVKEYGGQAYAEISPELQEVYGKTRRGLSSRHMQLITIGSSIGTGMFVGIGSALARSGPLSVFLAFTIYSLFVLFPLFMCATEMCTWLPVRGSIFQFAERYVDPALGFAGGYIYWYGALMLICSDFTGAVSVIQFWDDKTNPAYYLLVLIGLSLILNVVAVRWYGEIEFVTASFKIFLMLGLIMATFITMLGGNPNHDRYGFRHWQTPMKEYLEEGALGRFLGFWRIFIYAGFACGGPDVVMMCSGEVQNPRAVIPAASRKIYFRLGVFYIVGTLALGIICDSSSPELLGAIENGGSGSAASPWVIGLRSLGIDTLANLVNAVVLTSAWSCGNAYVYAASRTLYALSINGKAPAIFQKCNKAGVPMYCLIVVGLVSCLTFLSASNSTATVLNWFINLSAISLLMTYMVILFTYTRFRKAVIVQMDSTAALPFRTPFNLQPYISWVGFCFCGIIIFFNGFYIFWPGEFTASGLLTAYFGVPAFVAAYLFWKLYWKSTTVKASEADIWSGKQEIDTEESEYLVSHGGKKKRWYNYLLDIIL
ncbi:AAT family amino acid transporter [Stachybotrys elegans]|uniref:AAT family amino acid transporter n=1 Tax=Stachybotrys elegans TaxID=80388 RepID=A0A8K0WSH4_9HYPO|nr:AAT family amino acid transporter [Stachybotrys elegans]